jgi:hypothetical protein
MASLKFKGEITLDEVFSQNKIFIYDNVLASIEKSYKNLKIDETHVVQISINEIEYSIKLSRDKYVGALEGAILFYESAEEYEKCQLCLNIINELTKKTVAI